MGLLDSIGGIFDSAKGMLGLGGASTTSSAQQLPTMTPEQQALFNQLISKAQTQLNAGAPNAYPGQMYVPETSYDTSYLNYDTGPRQKALSTLMSGQPAYDVSPEATREYFNKTIKPTYEREFFGDATTPGTLALLEQQFAGPNYWSSNRANQVSNAIQNYGTTLASKESELLYQDELARRTALENAMGRVSSGVTGDLASQTQSGTAAAYKRSIDQEKVVADLARWLGGESIGGTKSPYSGPDTQLALALLGISPYTYVQNQESSGAGLGYSMLQDVAEGAGQGLGAFLSTWRTKKK